MKDTSECTKVTLELLALEDTDQSLGVLTFIFIAISVKCSWELVLVLMSKENNVFTEILSGDTI